MKVILIAVESLDGKITRWDDVQDVSSWASSEDQDFFMQEIQKHKVLVMGSGSYEAVKDRLNLHEPRLRIVLTKNLEKYTKDRISGKLEFSSETPIELVDRLKKEGHERVLLLGGSALYTSFLKAKLVTDIYLTVEPRLFGKGKMLIADTPVDINLKLEQIKRLNDRGTLLLFFTPLY